MLPLALPLVVPEGESLENATNECIRSDRIGSLGTELERSVPSFERNCTPSKDPRRRQKERLDPADSRHLLFGNHLKLAGDEPSG